MTGVSADQIAFFRNNDAGCAFAAYAARAPNEFGWFHQVLAVDSATIDGAIRRAISDSKISTQSLIFPTVQDIEALLRLIETFIQCEELVVGQDVQYDGFRCIGFRVHVGSDISWVSGFGPYTFFPKTRQAPHTEIIFRTKIRPAYDWVMKEAPAGVIHLADMEMRGLSNEDFRRMWRSSHERTAHIIGHEPNLLSAAKTTFSIPNGV